MVNPSKIIQEFKDHLITKKQAIDLLVAIIDNSNNNSIRGESLKSLDRIARRERFYFNFLENLAISEHDVKIRRYCLSIVKNYFYGKSLNLIRWILQNEKDYKCLINSIRTLIKINNEGAKALLYQCLEQIKRKDYLIEGINYPKNKFKESISDFLHSKKHDEISTCDAGEIIINYYTMVHLFQKFYTVYYDLENGVVTHLDLSDVGWNANLWRQKYSCWITDVSEITGLKNLRHLKSLDLSNNRIKYVKKLIQCKSLDTLILCNNRIEASINQQYFQQMHNLKYLDLSGNKIIKIMNPREYLGIKLIRYKGLPIF